jgi:hypothetical protein
MPDTLTVFICLFLDADNVVRETTAFMGIAEAAAVQEGRRLTRAKQYAGFEIWIDGIRKHREHPHGEGGRSRVQDRPPRD